MLQPFYLVGSNNNNMSERRRWSRTETEILIDLMEKNYSFSTAAFNPTKTKAMVDKKWDEIMQSISSVGKGSSLLTTD